MLSLHSCQAHYLEAGDVFCSWSQCGHCSGRCCATAALVAAVAYCIRRRRSMSVAPTAPADFLAQPNVLSPAEAAAAVGLAATSYTQLPDEATAATSAIPLTSRPVEAAALPQWRNRKPFEQGTLPSSFQKVCCVLIHLLTFVIRAMLYKRRLTSLVQCL